MKAPRTTQSLLLVVLLVLGLLPGTAATAATAATLDGLTTNGRANPLGIPGADPVFGWKVSSPRRAVTQTAYEVEVGRTPGAADVWRSGRVASARQVDVAYGGPDLVSGVRYFWRVRIRDDQ